MAVVTPTDCPKSVRNRCVIEAFCCVIMLSRFYYFSVGVGAFVIGLSRISSFFSHNHCNYWLCQIFSFPRCLYNVLRPDNVILDHTKWKYHFQIQIWSITFIIHRAFYYIDSTNGVATERAAESLLTKGRQIQLPSMFVRRHCVLYNVNINC